MKNLFLLALILSSGVLYGQNTNSPTLRSVLLDQLKSTHNVKGWFVPVDSAIDGVTPEQAKWRDGSGNHSIGQLTNHLLFWNTSQLSTLTKIPPPFFSGQNDDTFNDYDSAHWSETARKLDSVLTALEKLVMEASEANLKSWSKPISNIAMHNAYHTGQIIFVRKLQGSWDPEKGVK